LLCYSGTGRNFRAFRPNWILLVSKFESPIAHTADVKRDTPRVRRVIPGLNVPIRAILENDHAFGPEDVADLTAAFEAALSRLGLVDRRDPLTGAVAKAIIQLAKDGERDPKKLCDGALKILGK
jgi:hypothetical protein